MALRYVLVLACNAFSTFLTGCQISKVQGDCVFNSGCPFFLEKADLVTPGLHIQVARAEKQLSTSEGVWVLSVPMWLPHVFTTCPAQKASNFPRLSLGEGIGRNRYPPAVSLSKSSQLGSGSSSEFELKSVLHTRLIPL